MTIVFAEERSAEGIKNAMFEGRTVAWFQNKLIGKEIFIKSLAEASLELKSPHHKTDKSEYRKLINHSSFHFYLEYKGKDIHLKPGKEIIITGSSMQSDYQFVIDNFITENGELVLVLQ